MSPLVEVQLIAWRELRKSVRSVKGLVLAAMTLAGGAGASMLFAWIDRLKREALPDGVDVQALQQQMFTQLYGAETGQALAGCPHSLWMMLMATLWLGPLLVALLGFDSIPSDLQHRTVRYWALRARRSSYVVGKFFGAWLVVLGVTLGMNVVVWAVTVVVARLPAGDVLSWGVRFFAVSIPISAAWCGIATLVGSTIKTPFFALLAICATFCGLWLVWVVSHLADIPALSYVYPNSYGPFFLSPRPTETARGLVGTCAIAVLTAGAAALLFERKDL
ncbi:MAG TPA: ABC transporter permease subunit [Polyangiaceae bacterium]|nr:ABC transporter permease subunit [Polyangiaceae bacterium]